MFLGIIFTCLELPGVEPRCVVQSSVELYASRGQCVDAAKENLAAILSSTPEAMRHVIFDDGFQCIRVAAGEEV